MSWVGNPSTNPQKGRAMTRYKDMAELMRSIGAETKELNSGEISPPMPRVQTEKASEKASEKTSTTDAQREIAKIKREHLQRKFVHWWVLFGGDENIVSEYKFHESRKWRFDFALPSIKVAIEINGGTYQERGGHNWGKHMVGDYEKWNAATMMGWRVLLFTSDMLTKKAAADVFIPIVAWTREMADGDHA